jgi:hypothetical protein
LALIPLLQKKMTRKKKKFFMMTVQAIHSNPKIKSFWVGTKGSFADENATHFSKQICF